MAKAEVQEHEMTRLIINDCEPDDYILATRAAKELLKYPPDHKDIVLEFENRGNFYAKRTLRGISVKKIK